MQSKHQFQQNKPAQASYACYKLSLDSSPCLKLSLVS
jgi:hypothetical protein